MVATTGHPKNANGPSRRRRKGSAMRLGKLMLAASCLAGLSVSLGAQEASASLRPVDLHGTVGEMLDQLGRQPRMVRTKVVGVDTTDSAFLFPSAGSVQGAGGTYFRSDVTL